MTSPPTIAPPTAPPPDGDELAELERELEVYLTFWAHARERSTSSSGSAHPSHRKEH